MNRLLKAIAATALGASAIGVGGLVTAPTASARPPRCDGLAAKAMAYHNTGRIMEAAGYTSLATFYYGQSQAYGDLAIDCYRGLP